MSKVAVVFWSGTGNTQAMADCVADGAKEKGAEVTSFNAGDFTAEQADAFDGIAFGCPAMGAEELEEGEFEPMFNAVSSKLAGKEVALFGSYGWGDGEWMRSWEDNTRSLGANIVFDSVICVEAPDEAAQQQCRDLGAALA